MLPSRQTEYLTPDFLKDFKKETESLARNYAKDERDGVDNVIKREVTCSEALTIGTKRFKLTVILKPE